MGKLLHSSIFVHWLHLASLHLVYTKISLCNRLMNIRMRAQDRVSKRTAYMQFVVYMENCVNLAQTALNRMHIYKRNARKCDRFIRAKRFEMVLRKKKLFPPPKTPFSLLLCIHSLFRITTSTKPLTIS